MADEFHDVDFSKQGHATGFTGYGNVDTYASYEASQVMVDPKDWQRLLEKQAAENTGCDAFVKQIKNQSKEGSCVGQATTSAVENIEGQMFGLDRMTLLGSISLYKQIGRSAGSGAMLGDALEAIRDVGILPLDTPENRAKYGNHVMKNTGFGTPFPSGWKTTAAKFKVTEWLVGRSFEGMVSASLCNKPIVYARSGHCILGVRFIWKGGKLTLKYQNSWGNWGDNGFGYDSESVARRASGYWFCPLQVVVTS